MWGNLIAPPAREQHSAAFVGRDLYIFGGKARVFPVAEDIVLNDLWRVTIPHSERFSFSYSSNNILNTVPQNISRSGRIYAAIKGADATSNEPKLATTGLCVEKVIVEVSFILFVYIYCIYSNIYCINSIYNVFQI